MFKYIASPYTAKTVEGGMNYTKMAERFDEVLDCVAHFFNEGEFVYSPIVHCHPVAEKHVLPRDFHFWQDYNRAMISAADELWVLCLEGWEHSTGVCAEIEFARKTGKPIYHVDPKSYDLTHVS